MHGLASSALFSGASTATFSQTHSPVVVATAQSAFSNLVTSMDWSQHQEPKQLPQGTVRKASMFDESTENDQLLKLEHTTLGNRNRAASGGVQKSRGETSGHNYVLSPTTAKTRRSCSSGASSQNGGEDYEASHNMGESTTDQRRLRFLERNRMAASKCRQKKKVWIQDLERRAEEATMQNRSLHIAVAQLKEEVLILRSQLLSHHGCGCSAVQRFVSSDAPPSMGSSQTAAAPLAAAPSMLFQAPQPQPMVYHQPQPHPYSHYHSSSVDMSDMSAMSSGTAHASYAVSSFASNMDGANS
ncbi:hypothetical protein GGI18_005916 [Coemansia linderi]|uniref:Uncharacterized protein n=1 Tax=Coemansia linderi TaxID=2663919 RepID=A0ACC1JTK0_9FUNG|nr:hypothetical protein GGI18_005916 [Coemansia linderi]